jgi:Fe2+ or Zn2+ uptake regulation protein
MATHSPQSGVVASRVNEIVGRLRERGHRLTPQRYAFVRALVEVASIPRTS